MDAADDWNDADFAQLDGAIEEACRNRAPLQNLQQPPPQQPRPLPLPPTAEPAWQPHDALRQTLMPGAPIPAVAPPAVGSSRQHAAAALVAPAPANVAPPAPAAAASQQIVRPEPQPFDPETIKTWVYPTNVSERQYQFEISSVAVRHNTLVSLPTGLGKTLIASVVMYNFYRWFPTGKCLFLAPTKPLVHQQVSAVRRAIGVPLADCAELTGQMPAAERARAWDRARLFFLTPQTLVSDIEQQTCPCHLVVCLVVDEAHKATGNHAYTQAVQYLARRSGGFRILALSATPGGTLDRIQEVVSKLQIHKLEARDETSIDVMGCLNERVQEMRKVALTGEVAAARDMVAKVYSRLLQRLQGHVYVPQLPRPLSSRHFTAHSLSSLGTARYVRHALACVPPPAAAC